MSEVSPNQNILKPPRTFSVEVQWMGRPKLGDTLVFLDFQGLMVEYHQSGHKGHRKRIATLGRGMIISESYLSQT